MQVVATIKYAHISAQKLRLVADLVRKRNVEQAIDILEFSTKKAADIVKKVLNSAIANAENNFGLDIDALWVSEVQVNEGPTQKRMRPRAKGRSNRILKRTSHIMIKVSDADQKKKRG